MEKSYKGLKRIKTYPCQYAGIHSHNLRQTFHGFRPYSYGTFPKDSQDLKDIKKKLQMSLNQNSFFKV